MEIALPYPPSVNHYWRRAGKKMYVTHKGKQYRKAVCDYVLARRAELKCCRRPMTGPLEVSVWVFPPNRARRDLDNILKALLDAMEHAGVYENDSQISRLVVERGNVLSPGGGVDVVVQPYEDSETDDD